MLDDRKKKVLQAIVEEYINTAEPVSSNALISKYDLNYSSATIRNEMADLEKKGLLDKMHTSSGRVPSAKGYRYYVDELWYTYPRNHCRLHMHRIDAGAFQCSKRRCFQLRKFRNKRVKIAFVIGAAYHPVHTAFIQFILQSDCQERNDHGEICKRIRVKQPVSLNDLNSVSFWHKQVHDHRVGLYTGYPFRQPSLSVGKEFCFCAEFVLCAN